MKHSSSTQLSSADFIGFLTALLPRFYAAYQASLAEALALLPVPGSPTPRHLAQTFVSPTLFEWSLETDETLIVSETLSVCRAPQAGKPLNFWEAMRRFPLLVLVGPPGVGKSTLLRHLAWQCASGSAPRHQVRLLSSERHDEPLENLVPVYVALTDPPLGDEDLIERMVGLFAAHGFPRARHFLQARLERGQCLLLFDNLSQIADEQARARALAEIVALARRYRRNQIIVAVRSPHDLNLIADRPLEAGSVGWTIAQGSGTQRLRCGVVWHCGFSPQAAREFVRRWFGAQGQGDTDDGLLDLLEQSPGLRDIAACPLCLTAMVAVEEGALWLEGARLTPLLDRASQALLAWPDAGHRGDTPSGPSTDMAALEDMAWYLHTRRARALFQEQLTEAAGRSSPEAVLDWIARSHLLLPDIDGSYRFAHWPWQSYFAARALCRPGHVPTPDILQHADDPWWQEVIACAAGQQADATDLIRGLRQHSNSPSPGPERAIETLFLAARCLGEARCTEPGLRDEFLDDLLAVFAREEPDLWDRAALAVAGALGKRVPEAFSELLKAGPAERRAAAAVALGRIGGDWAATLIREALWDEDWLVRQHAAWALGRIGGAAAVQRLVEALDDAQGEVRASAAEALAARGPVALPSLIGALGDGRPSVGQAAVDALAGIGPPAVEPLVRALGDSRDIVGRRVVESLSRIGQPALDPLTLALEADDALVRQRAARALGQIGLEESLPALIHRLDDSEEAVYREVQRALVGFEGRAAEPLAMALQAEQPEVRQRATEVLQAIGPPGLQALSRALGYEDRNIRRRAAEALGAMGDEQAVEAVTRALDDERPEVRRRAAEALGQIGGPQAREALSKALADPEPAVRRQAVVALGGLETDERTLVALVDALHDEDKDVREIVAQVLGRIRRSGLVDPFVIALRDENAQVRRRAASVLGQERDERAIGPLIQALSDGDEKVQELAAAALSHQGTPAVESLIRAIYNWPPHHPARQLGVRILGEISVHNREADTWLAGLAGTYFEIWTRPHTVDELLRLFSRLQWWPHGFELYQAFSTARAFLSYNRVEDLARCAQEMEWRPQVSHWLRPALKDILTEFSRVGDYVNLYSTAVQQSARHEGLIGAIYRLDGLRELIYERLDESEADAFGRAAERWGELLAQVQRQVAGGRADLALQVQTDIITLGRPGAPVIISAELINRGESPARNLNLSLRRSPTGAFEVGEGEQSKTLYPLGSGEGRTVEFTVVPHGPGEAELTFEARYADNEDADGFRLLSGRVRFQQRRAEYVPLPLSPYVTGLPVKTREMFFGREDVFEWVRDNLRGRYQDNVLVLWGQRRTGKTSVLYQLRARPPSPKHMFVLVDLEGLVNEISDHAGLFYGIAGRMHEQLEDLGLPVTGPHRQEYASHPEERFREFCREIGRRLDGGRVVLMLDEFDILLEKVQAGVIDEDVFRFIRGLMQHSELSFMFSGTYELRKKQQEPGWILFNTAISRQISYLDPDTARRLIEEPMRGLLTYHPLATDKILSVTAGQPYYIQYICNSLVDLARRQEKNDVDLTDVNEALERVVDEVMGTLNEDFETLSRPEQWALAALAHVSGEGRSLVPRAEIEAALKDGGLTLPMPDLTSALQQLVERDFIEERPEGQRFLYGFMMELTRTWLRQSKKYERFREEVR